jgi:omega-amidase
MKNLRITLIQTSLEWEKPGLNRLHFAGLFDQVKPGSSDIIVLPEMFTTGFSMTPRIIAEKASPDMPTLEWMRHWAAQLDTVITGSLATEEDQKFYNRLFWVRPDGTYSTYNKRHLFRMAGEDTVYCAGDSVMIEEWRGWKICPLICYDLRFPVWSRNKIVHGEPLYDVLLYTANWPSARREIWKKLLMARAIENQCYVAGLNRIGVDGNGLTYDGDSSFINPKGEHEFELTPSKEGVATFELDRTSLIEFREKFPVLLDGDQFQIK